MTKIPVKYNDFLHLSVDDLCKWLDNVCGGDKWVFKGEGGQGLEGIAGVFIITEDEAAIMFRLKFGI